MMKVLCGALFPIVFWAAAVCADTTLVDQQLAFKMYLPNNWVCFAESDSQRFFEDTSYSDPGLLSLTRHVIDSTLYGTPDQWTQAHFLGYKLSVEYSVDPAGVVLYSNSDTSVKQGFLQAAEAYSTFFSSDTSVGSWSEYVRYTACGRYGYELYAISDTADMTSHIGYYAALLQGVVIDPADRVVSPIAFRRNAFRAQRILSSAMYDPLGRETRGRSLSRSRAAGVYLRRSGAVGLLVR